MFVCFASLLMKFVMSLLCHDQDCYAFRLTLPDSAGRGVCLIGLESFVPCMLVLGLAEVTYITNDVTSPSSVDTNSADCLSFDTCS